VDVDDAMFMKISTTSAASTKTLRVTPAMEAGKADHVWSLEEIVGMAD
jgi:hypothetical protein